MISRRNRRKLRRREKRTHVQPESLGLDHTSLQQIKLARSLTGAQYYADNCVKIFSDGASKFEAFKRDLRLARHSINIQYYIFEDDRIGREVAEILISKVSEGVTVRLIYDHVGSFNVRSRFFKELRARGVEAYPFFKVTFPSLATRVNWRNHRKICIIDNAVGYIGGMNVADRYIDGGKKFDSWFDAHVRVTGPVVAALKYSFTVDWNFMGRGLIEDSECSDSPLFPREGISGVGAQVLTSGPTSQWANIALSFHKAISNARRRVFILTPYFLPTESLLRALQSAALSHVDVRLILPRRSDSSMLTYASASYIGQCLQAGIKVYLYEPGMLHAKAMIIDDEIVTVGSTNFDFRSFECNFEANLFMYSRELCSWAIEQYKQRLKSSTRVHADEWKHRPMSRKVGESVLRLLSPIL